MARKKNVQGLLVDEVIKMEFKIGKVAHPLGGAGYLFKTKESLLNYICSQLRKKKLRII